MPRKKSASCGRGKVRNPATNRCVQRGSKALGKKPASKRTSAPRKRTGASCGRGKVRNPATNRCVQRGSKALGKPSPAKKNKPSPAKKNKPSPAKKNKPSPAKKNKPSPAKKVLSPPPARGAWLHAIHELRSSAKKAMLKSDRDLLLKVANAVSVNDPNKVANLSFYADTDPREIIIEILRKTNPDMAKIVEGKMAKLTSQLLKRIKKRSPNARFVL
jgi:hypothetical protein